MSCICLFIVCFYKILINFHLISNVVVTVALSFCVCGGGACVGVCVRCSLDDDDEDSGASTLIISDTVTPSLLPESLPLLNIVYGIYSVV